MPRIVVFAAIAMLSACSQTVQPAVSPDAEWAVPSVAVPFEVVGAETKHAPVTVADGPGSDEIAVEESGPPMRIHVEGGDCEILVDGRALGSRRVRLPLGSHQLKCRRPDGTGPIQRVNVTATGPNQVTFKLL